MRQVAFAGSNMNFQPRALLKNLPSYLVISLGDIFVTPASGFDTGKAPAESISNQFMRTLPDYEG